MTVRDNPFAELGAFETKPTSKPVDKAALNALAEENNFPSRQAVRKPAGEGVVPASVSESEEMTRLTFDCPISLHRIIKTSCASRGTKIGHEIIALLQSHYAGKNG